MLRIKDLSVCYGDDAIFRGVHLEAEPGELIAICGGSGCGKSSLLKAVNGIIGEEEVVLQGEIQMEGRSVWKESIGERSRWVSTVFQNPKTQFYCTNTTDELAFALENRCVEREKIWETIRRCSKELGTDHLLDRNIFTLSGGEKQLIAITASVCMDNKVYLFDEPSASLDHSSIRQLQKILRQLKAAGKIILVAEHRLYYLKDLMDGLAVMHDEEMEVFRGKDLAEKNLGEIVRRYGLRTMEEITEKDLEDLERIRIHPRGKGKYRTEEAHLLCREFCVSYQGEKILDLSLGFDRGIHFIIGENGVGKTTFVKQLSGLIHGRGRGLYRGTPIKRHYQFMAMVMQDVNYQIFTESVWQEISIVSKDKRKKEEVLRQLGLLEKRELHPQSLSGGEKQRLLLGMTALSEKPVVVLDEPTSGLCKGKMLQIVQYLREMEKEGRTVLVITHDYELIRTCGGRIYEFVKEKKC